MNIEIKDFKVHQVVQGEPEWHMLRNSGFFTASEAPAMMGASTKMTRSQLLTAKATGITKEVSDYVQRFLFDKGHETEKQFLPHASEMVGEELFPATATATVNGIRLLASCDGSTIGGEALFEHKMLNKGLVDHIVTHGEPDMERVWQLEQQMLVTGAERVLVACGDGTLEGTTTCWYTSNPERRQQLILGWKVFAEDLAKWTPEDAVEIPNVEAQVVEKLPALVVQVSGELSIEGNMAEWKRIADRWLAAAPKPAELESDQDFADAEAFAKECANVEERLELVKAQALAQSRPLEELVQTLAEISERVRQTRLSMDRSVKNRKDSIKAKVVTDATSALMQYVGELGRSLGRPGLMPNIPANFAEAAKNKRTMASLRNSVDTELSQAKLRASEVHLRIKANLDSLTANGEDHTALFPDLAAACTKAADDFATLLQVRIQKHKEAVELAAEKKRLAERAEEERKRQADERASALQAAAPAVIPIRPATGGGVGTENRPQWSDSTGAQSGSGEIFRSAARQGAGAEPQVQARQQPVDAGAMLDEFQQDSLLDAFMETLTLPGMVRGAVRAAIVDWEAFKAGQMRRAA